SVEALPRTPSGKVDRNALPVADGGQIGGTGSRGELDAEEQAVLGVWCEILGVDEVDIHRDFFLVGGNSLSATQVVARLRDILEIEVPLRQFFDHPTIADTARWIRQNRVGAIPPPPLQS